MGNSDDDRGLVRELIGDGCLPLIVTGLALLFSGGFAIFLSLRREFLPQDVAFLGMTADHLCASADCRIVRFMFHDRVAFGGTLIAIAALYFWLASFPLRSGAAWAWWAFLGQRGAGVRKLLAYLGYRISGQLARRRDPRAVTRVHCGAACVTSARHAPRFGLAQNRRRSVRRRPQSGSAAGDCCVSAFGIALAGLVILYIGATEVFVAEDSGIHRPVTRGARRRQPATGAAHRARSRRLRAAGWRRPDFSC